MDTHRSKGMKPLHPGNSKHHLFTYHEVRARLVEIHGKPKTEADHEWLHAEIRRFRAAMPLYGLCEEFHRTIHKEPTPIAYTDVSYAVGDEVCGWCFVIILPNGAIIGPKIGTSLMKKGQNAEEIPKEKVRRAATHLGINDLIIRTDHVNRGKPDEVRCNKMDPWHIVCHFASKFRRTKSNLNRKCPKKRKQKSKN